ncbi:hypothetical protein, partial [Wolbachia endosymbiont of Litomosoides brasiliensis]|uniref:hypothetical protein n=1 Tax=Wolbachia endosymbiont of Litomosoides brasiliensis TaxID=1812117 RepID=UPI001C5557B8
FLHIAVCCRLADIQAKFFLDSYSHSHFFNGNIRVLLYLYFNLFKLILIQSGFSTTLKEFCP